MLIASHDNIVCFSVHGNDLKLENGSYTSFYQIIYQSILKKSLKDSIYHKGLNTFSTLCRQNNPSGKDWPTG